MNDHLNDENGNHEPTPEFRASLEREIARAWRSEIQFDPPSMSRRTRRIAAAVGIAAGAVTMLTIGLVLGANTGYASAGEIVSERGDTPLPPQPALAVLKNIPNITSLGCMTPPAIAKLPGQQGVPIVELPAARVKTSLTLGSVLGLRELPNGDVLVDDADRRQIRLMDSTLNTRSIVRDSIPGTSTSYGPRPVPLIRYLGDSSLIVDRQGGSMLVMGPSGQISRVMAGSDDNMLLGLVLDFGAVDSQGRIFYAHGVRNKYERGLAGGIESFYSIPDSAGVMRIDLDTRRVDTLAVFKRFGGSMMINNSGKTRFTADPAPLLDGWAMTSNGVVGVVRAQDYHVDWVMPDGSTKAGPKMPFDWKRLTDEDKQKLIDSTRDEASPKMALNLGRRRAAPPPDGDTPGRTGRGSVPASEMIQGPPVPVEYVPPKLSEMFDFYPPIRQHAVMPDLQGNLWILPTTSAQSKNGELVYDVTNPKGEFHRVRVPVGRSVAGFGAGGVVYLLSGDKTNGFYLEKSRLPGSK